MKPHAEEAEDRAMEMDSIRGFRSFEDEKCGGKGSAWSMTTHGMHDECVLQLIVAANASARGGEADSIDYSCILCQKKKQER
mmetsp:Transcript_4561/g.8900  ORF Transcript_4561/g.8900 Transcript_4561/m.8900 type:complete len:82 (+) Transcript_4561:387-632(+)